MIALAQGQRFFGQAGRMDSAVVDDEDIVEINPGAVV
jgi:hypothetical protein